jgi:hypothetical protein
MQEEGDNPAQGEDAALLARITAGDEDAFVALYLVGEDGLASGIRFDPANTLLVSTAR